MPGYTLHQIESVLLARAKGKMALAGLSTLAQDNPDLVDPISTAAREMGQEVALDSVEDADLEFITTDTLDEFLNRAHLALLRNVYGNLGLVDIQVGDRRESLSQIKDQLKDEIKVMTALIPGGDDSITGGLLRFDWMAKSTDEIE